MESSNLKQQSSLGLENHRHNSPIKSLENTNQDLSRLLEGYRIFKEKYVHGEDDLLKTLSEGQKPQFMIVTCCDSRVDPALLFQCKPGDLFVARSIANFVMPFNRDSEVSQGVSAALEFGICVLNVPNLIILGHSGCGGIEAFLDSNILPKNDDFISRWLQGITVSEDEKQSTDTCAKAALVQSYKNCLTFPWIRSRVLKEALKIHLWFFDIETGELNIYKRNQCEFEPI